MLRMDLKYKGIAWVGNIYQRFETVCEEVDNIVSQDTVKYVGNQVQTLGKSMKRFCSDVVHDILPPLIDPLKHQVEENTLNTSADVSTNVELKVEVQGNHIDADNMLLHKVPISTALVGQQLGYALKGSHFEDKPVSQTSVNPLHSEESNLAVGSSATILTDEVVLRDNLMKKKASSSSSTANLTTFDEQECGLSKFNSLDRKQLLDTSLLNECIGFDDKLKSSSLEKGFSESSVSGGKFLSEKKFMVNESYADELECPSDDSRASSYSDLDTLTSFCAQRIPEEVIGSSVCDRKFPFEQKFTGQHFADEHKCVSSDSKAYTSLELSSLTLSDGKKITGEGLNFSVPVGNFASHPVFSGKTSVDESNYSSDESRACKYSIPNNFSCEASVKEKGIDSSGFVDDGTFLSWQNVRTMNNNFTDESLRITSVTSAFNLFEKTYSTGLHDGKNADSSRTSLLNGSQASVNSQEELAANEQKPIDEPGFVSDVFSLYTPARLSSIENKVHESWIFENAQKESPADGQKPVDMPRFVPDDVYSLSVSTPPLAVENKMPEMENVLASSIQPLRSSGPLTDSADDISVSSMETIELSEKEKLEGSCVIVDNTAPYAVSHITRKHMSYKKMIQNAFTSRKRLAKEYEQLAIWFGDADIFPDQDSSENLLPSATSRCKSTQTDLMHDSEWEVL